jgi:hypothetical protein
MRTTRFVALPSIQTTGRHAVAIHSNGRAAANAQPSALCMAMRFGASSPTTSVTKVRINVTATIATASAAVPRNASGPTSGSAKAPFTKISVNTTTS